MKAAELTAKQRAHVLFTIPEFLKAGEPFKLCYNPKNTTLKDATGVSVVGGWNRWSHEQALPITKLSPDPSCKADSQDYFSVELTSPKDAFMFDFVFCDQDGNNYDNRNRLDYHLPSPEDRRMDQLLKNQCMSCLSPSKWRRLLKLVVWATLSSGIARG